MTKEDEEIIESLRPLAIECGINLEPYYMDGVDSFTLKVIEATKLAERKRCAEVVESVPVEHKNEYYEDVADAYRQLGNNERNMVIQDWKKKALEQINNPQ